MTLWGCRLGKGFMACAAANYSLGHAVITAIVAMVVAAALLRLLDWFVR